MKQLILFSLTILTWHHHSSFVSCAVYDPSKEYDTDPKEPIDIFDYIDEDNSQITYMKDKYGDSDSEAE